MDEIECGDLRRSHSPIGSIKASQALETMMGPVAILLYQIVGHHAGIFLPSGKLAALNAKTVWEPAKSSVDDAFTERRRQIQNLRCVQRELLFWKGLAPNVDKILVDLEQLGFVIAEGLPTGKVLGPFGQMHFSAHEISASKNDTDTKGIV